MQFAYNVGPDQRAYLCSLNWEFSVRRHIQQYPLILYVQADQGLHCPQII